MAYNEDLADRVRGTFAGRKGVAERKMFGGLTFMVSGHMCCGVTGDLLMVRVGADGFDDALAQPHARPMDFTGRPMAGFVYVEPQGTQSADHLGKWIRRAEAFVDSLPPK